MKLNVKELVIFAMLGALMYASKLIMEMAPNIHLIGVFVIALTVVYRSKALYPIYVFVFLFGLYYGFALWWLPYLYVWAVLWGVVMLLPEELPQKLRPILYMTLCGLHGLLYGVLYAPTQALLYGLNLKSTLAWIAAGLPFDVIHGISNFFCAILVLPCVAALRLGQKTTQNT